MQLDAPALNCRTSSYCGYDLFIASNVLQGKVEHIVSSDHVLTTRVVSPTWHGPSLSNAVLRKYSLVLSPDLGDRVTSLIQVWLRGIEEQRSGWTVPALASQDLSKTVPDCYTVATAHDSQIEFHRLRKTWYAERGVSSSLSEITSCRSYQRIIEMGQEVLPLILAQIEREGDDPDHWFKALAAITKKNPVTEEMFGDTVKMADAWLSWARNNYASGVEA